MPPWNKSEVLCMICGAAFFVTQSRLQRGNVKYCSRRCHKIAKRGPDRIINGDGYVLIRCEDHPRPVGTGHFVYEHILVMENHLGRYLAGEEQVHHDNDVKSDNRIENLVLCPNYAYHAKLHVAKRIRDAGGDPLTDKICCRCQKPKPRTEFGKGDIKSHSDGLRGYCYLCQAAYVRERRANAN